MPTVQITKPEPSEAQVEVTYTSYDAATNTDRTINFIGTASEVRAAEQVYFTGANTPTPEQAWASAMPFLSEVAVAHAKAPFTDTLQGDWADLHAGAVVLTGEARKDNNQEQAAPRQDTLSEAERLAHWQHGAQSVQELPEFEDHPPAQPGDQRPA